MFKTKRPDKDFGYEVESNYDAALEAISKEINLLLNQTDRCKIPRKLISDLGKIKYSIRSNTIKEKGFELEMGLRYVENFKNLN
ncbi:MAG: hypothetical protein AAGF07_01145 [Patescibacteria group bacterium]